MIEINLLPKDLRKRSHIIRLPRTARYVALGVGALLVAVVGATIMQRYQMKKWQMRIQKTRTQVEQMRRDIQVVDALEEVKAKILDRLSAIEQLDRNRAVYVSMFEDLARRVPEYLWLTTFKEGLAQPATAAPGGAPPPTAAAGTPTPGASAGSNTPQRTKMEGFAYSLNSIATFLIQMKKSNFFKNIELEYAREQ